MLEVKLTASQRPVIAAMDLPPTAFLWHGQPWFVNVSRGANPPTPADARVSASRITGFCWRSNSNNNNYYYYYC